MDNRSVTGQDERICYWNENSYFSICTIILSIFNNEFDYTLCYDMLTIASLSVLFVIFLILSKRYTLRERNREINIQAIVEEHYERYMDQEEEYERVHGNDH